ncbi:hypothetical protein P691DRAFT_804993 [Macrolepiota fuliginosa MF-IS2]|uniref:Uncharacterized protein n=1 Tax=Macrolepiota fuliginosa MF-IS2 TaxID=1400762 RepID=A0A9P5X7D3_9AGAR|nr:hypothetical protein P691DRAFT_804993 [Macrolepiota fuliginosa MF-IS2]
MSELRKQENRKTYTPHQLPEPMLITARSLLTITLLTSATFIQATPASHSYAIRDDWDWDFQPMRSAPGSLRRSQHQVEVRRTAERGLKMQQLVEVGSNDGTSDGHE